jgi:hypothetical protein
MPSPPISWGYTPILRGCGGEGEEAGALRPGPAGRRAVEYACEDADLTLRLRERFLPELEEHRSSPLPGAGDAPGPGPGGWSGTGSASTPLLPGDERPPGRELELLQEEIWKEAGEEFNINSNPQLREILFEKLELPVIKRTKTGPSTDASVLEELAAQGHTLPRHLLEYRQLEKLRSTYVDALPRLVNPGTGRIHASFNQTVAATGRLSSSDPNLQNIPIRTELGREIRKGFVPEDGAPLPGRRLLPDRAPDPGPLLRGRGLRHGLPGGDRRPPADRLGDLRRPPGGGDPGAAGPGQDHQLRHPLRPGGVLPGPAARDLPGGGRRAFIEEYFERFSGVRRSWTSRWRWPGRRGTWRPSPGGAATSPSSSRRTGTCGSSGSGWPRTPPSRGRRRTSSRRPCSGSTGGSRGGSGGPPPGAGPRRAGLRGPEAEVEALRSFVVRGDGGRHGAGRPPPGGRGRGAPPGTSASSRSPAVGAAMGAPRPPWGRPGSPPILSVAGSPGRRGVDRVSTRASGGADCHEPVGEQDHPGGTRGAGSRGPGDPEREQGGEPLPGHEPPGGDGGGSRGADRVAPPHPLEPPGPLRRGVRAEGGPGLRGGAAGVRRLRAGRGHHPHRRGPRPGTRSPLAPQGGGGEGAA